MHRLIAQYGLPPVEFHPMICGYEVDFRVCGAPIILECDGWTYHGLQRSTFERDRERDADLAAAGWIVLRSPTVRSRCVRRQRPTGSPPPSPDGPDISPTLCTIRAR
jgi:hypothetical protein